MYKKLNDPDFRIPYIHKGRKIIAKSYGQREHLTLRKKVWHPKEIRHKDLSHLRVKLPAEMSRKEFEEWNEMCEMDKNN